MNAKQWLKDLLPVSAAERLRVMTLLDGYIWGAPIPVSGEKVVFIWGARWNGATGKYSVCHLSRASTLLVYAIPKVQLKNRLEEGWGGFLDLYFPGGRLINMATGQFEHNLLKFFSPTGSRKTEWLSIGDLVLDAVNGVFLGSLNLPQEDQWPSNQAESEANYLWRYLEGEASPPILISNSWPFDLSGMWFANGWSGAIGACDWDESVADITDIFDHPENFHLEGVEIWELDIVSRKYGEVAEAN